MTVPTGISSSASAEVRFAPFAIGADAFLHVLARAHAGKCLAHRDHSFDRTIGSTSAASRFNAPITSGAEFSISFAIASASASRWPFGTTRLTNPTS